MLSRSSILIHFDATRTLWIDLDASKEFGFGIIIFHVKEGTPIDRWPQRTSVQPIIFLSRLLLLAEQNYWPTKLEIAGFVWAIKKVKHMIESSLHPVVIQTDHSAIIDIMKQTSIVATSSTIRMNVCLVRASQFLRQFTLEVRHKPGKEHIISDVLSHLASTNRGNKGSINNYLELDALYGVTCSLVKMSSDFKKRLVKSYAEDDWYACLLRQIDENNKLGEDAAMLSFVRGRSTTSHDPYFQLCPESTAETLSTSKPAAEIPQSEIPRESKPAAEIPMSQS